MRRRDVMLLKFALLNDTYTIAFNSKNMILYKTLSSFVKKKLFKRLCTRLKNFVHFIEL